MPGSVETSQEVVLILTITQRGIGSTVYQSKSRGEQLVGYRRPIRSTRWAFGTRANVTRRAAVKGLCGFVRWGTGF